MNPSPPQRPRMDPIARYEADRAERGAPGPIVECSSTAAYDPTTRGLARNASRDDTAMA
jgi:hypothetical protein